jgi:hypothetical protein
VTLTAAGASTITATSSTRNSSTGIVTASFNIPSTATITAYTVNAIFGPNTWSLTGGFTVTAQNVETAALSSSSTESASTLDATSAPRTSSRGIIETVQAASDKKTELPRKKQTP